MKSYRKQLFQIIAAKLLKHGVCLVFHRTAQSRAKNLFHMTVYVCLSFVSVSLKHFSSY